MDTRFMGRHYGLTCALAFALFTLVKIPDIVPTYEVLKSLGADTSLFAIALWQLADLWMWVVLLPGIIFLGLKFRFRRGAIVKTLLVNLAASVLFGVLKFGSFWALLPLLVSDEFIDTLAERNQWRETVYGFLTDIAMYWILLAGCNGFANYRRYVERKRRLNQLETQLVEARLRMLKMQLNPHFLFNTLNAIATLVRRKTSEAEQMICRLSELLRLSLESEGANEVVLRHELDILGRYLEIERIRFGDRLEIEMDIEPNTLNARVPSLILQPIVENAVTHGVCKRASKGRISLKASRRNGTLCIEIADNGPGFPEGRLPGKQGLGISTTLSRLEMLYGEEGRLELDSPEEGGSVVRITLPFRTESTGKDAAAGAENHDE